MQMDLVGRVRRGDLQPDAIAVADLDLLHAADGLGALDHDRRVLRGGRLRLGVGRRVTRRVGG